MFDLAWVMSGRGRAVHFGKFLSMPCVCTHMHKQPHVAPLLTGLLQINKRLSFSVLLSGSDGGWSYLVNVLPAFIQTVSEDLQSFLPTAFCNYSFCERCLARYIFKTPSYTVNL